ncbi:hypothetical protein J6V86_02575 [bacterium]|nr:hypothetical protein [bacterium]
MVNVCNYKLLQLDKKNKSKKGNSLEKVQLFDFSSETWESIKKNTPLLAHVAKERIKEELCKPFQK